MRWDDIAAKAYFGLGIVALVAIPAVLAWMGLGLIGLLFALPLLAWIASRLIVNEGGVFFSWTSRQALGKWQGTYYSFNDVQVRVYEDDEELWFVVGDVLKSVGLKGVPDSFLAIYPRDCKLLEGTRFTVMNPTGLEHMLGKRNDREAIRFLQWMNRDVMRPWQRKRERPGATR